MGQSELFRALAIMVLIGAFIATLMAINRQPATPVAPDLPFASTPDDLSAELRRCSALGPKDAEDQHCQAVWEKNRRRFFGRPARPVPPEVAPANSSLGAAHE
ncbi:MAG: putative entry exclusion protein TrbK-alt [Methylovirgula sp.]